MHAPKRSPRAPPGDRTAGRPSQSCKSVTARARLPADISRFPEAVYDQLKRIEAKVDRIDEKVNRGFAEVNSRLGDLEDDLRSGFEELKGMIDI